MSQRADKYSLLHPSQAMHAGVGPKAAMLARALNLRLPVPHFRVLPHELLSAMLSDGIVQTNSDEFAVSQPHSLQACIGAIDILGELAIRSAFSAEDGATQSLAGHFQTVLGVDPKDASALSQALCRVWSSSRHLPGVERLDVILMQMVDARHAGVAFLERDFPDDLVNSTDGLADALLSGAAAARRFELQRHASGNASHPKMPPWQQRLQRMLGSVRTAFGDHDWDVEWADDGQACWLLQIRPITQATLRDEVFTMANHREILPDPPSRFMTTLIAECAPALFGYYRGFDNRLPRKRRFIEVLHGRPLINLSLLLDMVRLWGLPSRLVTHSIGGISSNSRITPFGFSPERLLRSLPVLLRQGLAQFRAPYRSRTTARRLIAVASQPHPAPADPQVPSQLGPLLSRAAEIYTLLVTDMLALTAAISGPTSLLRRAGVLASLSRRHRSVSTAMHDDLSLVAAALANTPEATQQLASGELSGSEPFSSEWRRWLRAYGHRGVYESDLSMPRFHECPESLFPALLATSPSPRATEPLAWKAWLLWPIWVQARSAIDARERLRSESMRAFDLLRQQLLREAQRLVDANRLPSPEHLWLLTAEECRRMDTGWTPDSGFWQQRETDEKRRAELHVPDLLRRFEPLPGPDHQQEGFSSEWTGIGLTRGEAAGRAWVLREPQSSLPPGFHPASTILVARAVDAGWIPTFRLVAGVAVEIGGDLSHGSIILRELGIPAVTNLQGITAALHTGETLTLNAREGSLSRVGHRERHPVDGAESAKHPETPEPQRVPGKC